MVLTTARRPLSWSLHCFAVLLLAPLVLTQAYSVQYCSPDLNNDANESQSHVYSSFSTTPFANWSSLKYIHVEWQMPAELSGILRLRHRSRGLLLVLQ